MEEVGKVLCRVCGKHLEIINTTHLKRHDMTVNDYKLQYPGSPMIGNRFRLKKTQNDVLSQPTIEEEISYEDLSKDLEGTELKVEDELPEVKAFQIPPGCPPEKFEFFSDLKMVYPNLQLDYNLRKENKAGSVLYSLYFDMADPKKKHLFIFKGFWWACDLDITPQVKRQLEANGWKVFYCKSRGSLSSIIREASWLSLD